MTKFKKLIYRYLLFAQLLLVFCGVTLFAQSKQTAEKRPVIFIPGMLGSELVNATTGETVWFTLKRSHEDELDLPLSPNLAADRDNLKARQVLRSVKPSFFLPKVNICKDLLIALEKAGYRAGNWETPAPDGDHDSYYVFSYDWRRDNVESAQLLIKQIAALKSKLKRPDLKFNLVTYSLGGLVAQYAARYGDADLPAEGVAPVPTWAGAQHINRIFNLGTPQQGTIAMLRVMLKGYFGEEDGVKKVFNIFTSKLTGADILSMPATYQLLPPDENATFLDENLKPMSIDFYNPKTWRQFGWSGQIDEGFLTVALGRARRFHEALAAPVSEIPVPIYAYGGDCVKTLVAPVLVFDNKQQKWLTLTRPQEIITQTGRKISSKEVEQAMFAPGDGRVTLSSAFGDANRAVRANYSAALTSPPLYRKMGTCSNHGDLPSNKTLQSDVLATLTTDFLSQGKQF